MTGNCNKSPGTEAVEYKYEAGSTLIIVHIHEVTSGMQDEELLVESAGEGASSASRGMTDDLVDAAEGLVDVVSEVLGDSQEDDKQE